MERQSTETGERERARTPLALRFEVMGCEFATTVHPEGQMVPLYTFNPPCPFGKTQPDQECRMCRHVRTIPLGANAHWSEHRYIGVGAVFPIPSEECADAIVEVLQRYDALPLERPRDEGAR